MAKNSETKDENHFTSLNAVNCSSSEEGLPVASQPRQPRNFQDLLRYSTEVSNLAERENTHSSDVSKPLDEEAKKFIEDAIKSLTVDVVQELLKSIQILQGAHLISEDGDPTECEEALDNIFDYVDNLDVANDFHKIGGFCVFKPCLESVHNSLRWRGAELIAELCQNNPYCQNKVLETGLMPSLLRMIDTDIDDTVRVKALYAVSCLARGSEEGLEEFISADGFSVLLRALQTDIQKLNTKSAFLLSTMCHSKPKIKDDLINMGYVEQLISQLALCIQICDEGNRSSMEHLLNAILSIVTEHEAAQEIARKPELRFKNLLDFVVKTSENDDQYLEENEYAKKLIEIVFGNSESFQEDR